MILVCGATGDLGGRIVRLLHAQSRPVRALVRPRSSASGLPEGVEVVRGDITDEDSLLPCLDGVDTVITTANAIGRILAGAKDISIASVDRDGNANLVATAAAAGVERFIFVSIAGMSPQMAALAPLAAAKWAAEEALRSCAMPSVIVRPDMFQEVWLAPQTGINPASSKALIYGRGQSACAYVATDDVAAMCAHLAMADTVPELVEFGGPQTLTRLEVVAAFEAATGRRFRVRHVPRPVLKIGARVLARPKPAIASLMGMSLFADTHPSGLDAAPLVAAGIKPTPACDYISRSCEKS
jgi:NADH dehydrogenase